ncbi:MAG: ATP-binding protein [Pseudomonadota bacterium]
MALEKRLQPTADLQGIADSVGLLRAMAAQAELAEEQITFAALCLEEALTNVVMHGVADCDVPSIAVTLTFLENTVSMELSDNGVPFDPTAFSPAETPQDLLTAGVGGFGIRLIQEYADTMTYERIGDRNILKLTCRLPEAKEPPG